MDLIPVKTFKEAINSNKITLKHKSSLTDRVLHYWRYWKVATIILLLGLILANVISQLTRDKNPVELKVAGSKIEVYNIKQQKLWEYDFGVKIEQELYKKRDKNPSDKINHSFVDLDKDGINELVFLSRYNKVKNSSVITFSSTGKILWDYDSHPELQFEDNVYKNTYDINNIYTHSFNGEVKIFAVFSHYLYYPARIVVLNDLGEHSGEYINAGHIYSMQFLDIDNDDTDEIIFGGCNNAYNQAFIAAIEIDNIGGHSPPKNNLRHPDGITDQNEIYYVKFPYPKELAFGQRNHVVLIQAAPESNLIVSVDFGQGVEITYILDKLFNITELFIADGAKMNLLLNYGIDIDGNFPVEYVLNKLSKLEYWDGTRFIDRPTALQNHSTE